MSTDPPQSTVAQEIRAELARQRKAQAELAEYLGLSQAAVSDRLSDKVEFRVSELLHVAAFLGVPVTQLLPLSPDLVDGTPNPHVPQQRRAS